MKAEWISDMLARAKNVPFKLDIDTNLLGVVARSSPEVLLINFHISHNRKLRLQLIGLFSSHLVARPQFLRLLTSQLTEIPHGRAIHLSESTFCLPSHSRNSHWHLFKQPVISTFRICAFASVPHDEFVLMMLKLTSSATRHLDCISESTSPQSVSLTSSHFSPAPKSCLC